MPPHTITPPAYLGQWGTDNETTAEEEQELESLSSLLNIDSDLKVTDIPVEVRQKIAKVQPN